MDGRPVAAAQEERFSRRKHDSAFPTQAARYCLSAAGLAIEDVDYVAFYDKPLVKFERLLETYIAYAPRGFRSFRQAIPVWLREKMFLPRAIRKGLGGRPRNPLVFLDHHESHAASAFFPSPFDEAAILTMDGVGEWSTTCMGTGRDNRIELTHHLSFPHSLGLLYSAFTYYCGFKVNSGEYKLMGLAPYGEPKYKDLILDKLVDLRPDGSIRLHMEHFNFCRGLTMTGRRFHDLFGGPPRDPESRLLDRHTDIAASIQAVTEEAVLRMTRHLHEQSGQKDLVLAGGVALNCVANGRVLREAPFERIWVQPAAGDAGGSIGAAWFVWHQLLENPRTPPEADSQHGSLLGPAYSTEEIRSFLNRAEAPARECADEPELCETVAELLEDGNVVGWFHGRMEFGPRALGARSILGDARSTKMQATLNLKIKFRESFRPFAPIVLAEHAHEWFDIRADQDSPYMLIVAPVLESRRAELDDEQRRIMTADSDLCRRVNVPRSSIPAVTHVDYSARLQTVDAARNPRLHGLMQAFQRRTGCPVLVNTSFNVRGEPIVCSPADAFRCFMATDMDVLVLGNFVIRKQDMDAAAGEEVREAHLAQFQLD